MKISAIIPAGGSGVRMGIDVPKQFLEIDGQPILAHTLRTLEESEWIHSMVLVMPASEVDRSRQQWSSQFPKLDQVIAGGNERQDSVNLGLKALKEDTEIVIVHDGVRPFLDNRMIRETIEAAKEYGAAITAIPLTDTVKRDDGKGFVRDTVDRNGLWRIQTPQTFRYAWLREAMEKAMAARHYCTDEGALMEYIQKPVKIVAGSVTNIKITQPEDLAMGERILASRKDSAY